MDKEQEYVILGMALEAGFSLSTVYGQDTNKLRPISDSKTILRFAELVLQSKQTQEPECKHEWCHKDCNLNDRKCQKCGVPFLGHEKPAKKECDPMLNVHPSAKKDNLAERLKEVIWCQKDVLPTAEALADEARKYFIEKYWEWVADKDHGLTFPAWLKQRSE